MGTTADKLQNILNAKNAIKEKFSIGDDVKFIDYADNINTGSGGIVVPENFRPASLSDVLWGKQFFNCRGELVSGSNYGIYSFDILCLNLNDTIPEKYMDLVGWYNKIAEDTLSDGTIYERIVQYPNTTKRYVFEHYSLASLGGWVWELQDEQNSLFVSGVSAEPVEIWEAKNWRPAVSVHPDLEGAEILIRSYLQRNSGSTAEYFKCAAVFTSDGSGSTSASTDIIVSGAGTTEVNGTYVLQNASATGYDRIWKNENDVYLYAFNSADEGFYRWALSFESTPPSGYFDALDTVQYWSDEQDDPWGTELWHYVNGGYDDETGEGIPTVALAGGGSTGSGNSTDIVVSGFDDDHFNGTYTLEDASATGIYRVWVKGDIRIQTDQDTEANTAVWRFLTPEWSNEDNPSVAYSHVPYENPWDATEWFLYTDYHDITGEPVVKQASGTSASTDIIVSGCDYTAINGTYKLTEETKNNTGKERQWYNTSDPSITIYHDAGWWCIGKYGDYTMAQVHSDVDDPVSISSDFGPSDVDFTNPPKLAWAGDSGSGAPEVPANTWTGYKAVLTTDADGKKYYEFEETITEGLSYGYGFTPIVGKVYDREAMVEAQLITKSEMPTDGLLFFAPLEYQKSTAETGQILNYNGNVRFMETDGRQCAYFDGDSYLQFSDNSFPSTNENRTVACRFKIQTLLETWSKIFEYGMNYMASKFCIAINDPEGVCFSQNGGEIFAGVMPSGWCSVVVTQDSTAGQKIYIDGILKASGNVNVETELGTGYIGRGLSGEYFKGYIADVMVYNRALTEEEIQQLYQEFKA